MAVLILQNFLPKDIIDYCILPYLYKQTEEQLKKYYKQSLQFTSHSRIGWTNSSYYYYELNEVNYQFLSISERFPHCYICHLPNLKYHNRFNEYGAKRQCSHLICDDCHFKYKLKMFWRDCMCNKYKYKDYITYLNS